VDPSVCELMQNSYCQPFSGTGYWANRAFDMIQHICPVPLYSYLALKRRQLYSCAQRRFEAHHHSSSAL